VVPSQQSGDLEVDGDVDWFRIEAVEAGQYVFSTSLDTLRDSTLRLYASDGASVLSYNDDFGEGLASRIQWQAPTTNVYYLAVAAFNSTQTGTYTLQVEGPPQVVGLLSVDIVADSIPEQDGSTEATVTRSGSTSAPLTIGLASSDTSEAIVPSTITIPAGASGTTFKISGVGDNQLDGDQTVVIEASAAGFTSGSDSLLVTDSEGGGSGDDHGNTASAATQVDVSSSSEGDIEYGKDVDWFRFDATEGVAYELRTSLDGLSDSTLTLYGPDGTTQLAFNDDADDSLASRIDWTAPATGTYYVRVAAYGDAQTGTYSLEVSGPPPVSGVLAVEIRDAEIVEGGGSTSATVIRSGSIASPLVVALQSSDTTEAVVPNTVTIPAGASSVNFQVAGVQDDLVDGGQSVTISATALGFSAWPATVLVADQDGGVDDDHGDSAADATPVAMPSVTSGNIETGKDVDWFQFTAQAGGKYVLRTSLDKLGDSTLYLYATDGTTLLASNDDDDQSLASRIEWTAPADGTYYLKVAAFNASQTGTYGLQVTGPPSTARELSVELSAATVAESGGAAEATVTRTGPTLAPLVVTLHSSDSGEAIVPSSVTIPAGAASATFPVMAVDDNQPDGTQLVTITAKALGFTSQPGFVSVLDDEGGTGGGGDDDHGDGPATATSAEVPSITTGIVEEQGDVDWFRFYALAGNQYVFTTSLGTLSDTTLALFAPDGTTRLAINDDFGGTLASQIEWIAPSSGLHYLRVAPYEQTDTGSYTLRINSSGGTSDDDFIFGSPEGDVINGGPGDDYIYGGDGNDVLSGGTGNDVIYGGNGNDVIWGGAGNDVLVGGAGDDVLIGDSGDDDLFGSGNDYLDGGPGVDNYFANYDSGSLA
jgi:Ca2+-binding RTX toxin-like protein